MILTFRAQKIYVRDDKQIRSGHLPLTYLQLIDWSITIVVTLNKSSYERDL